VSDVRAAPTPRASGSGAGSGRWGFVASLALLWPRVEPALLAIWCAACAGFVCGLFRESMLVQTTGQYSAPLDDVWIHFDYARAAARGYPLQWSEGNGVSSGNTSLLYPFVLAVGWWAGLRDERLMAWALVVAFVCVVLFLWITARLLAPLGRFAKYLVPPVVLSPGPPNWSFWAGLGNPSPPAVFHGKRRMWHGLAEAGLAGSSWSKRSLAT